MSEHPLAQAALDEIVRRCREEQRRSSAEENGYCYELFRRAIEERCDEAWTAIQQQYGPLLLKWAHARMSDLTVQEAEDIVGEAISKFLKTWAQRDIRLSEHFEHIGGVLGYLRQCVTAAAINHARRGAREQRRIEWARATQDKVSSSPCDETFLDEICAEEQLEAVREWIRTCVTDPQEQLILMLSFERGLSPAEIVRLYPHEFPTTTVVNRIKERVCKRAKRALLNSDYDEQ
ncbi:MAG TPA: sigma-70 family RNA polymerase sigma factor [Anaerolineae bacterium]|nr:sigma-70 family RNA polymerase sigma factor [Anaerolineae bacterium]